MLPDRVSNPGPLTYESGALPIALRGPARTGIGIKFQSSQFELQTAVYQAGSLANAPSYTFSGSAACLTWRESDWSVAGLSPTKSKWSGEREYQTYTGTSLTRGFLERHFNRPY